MSDIFMPNYSLGTCIYCASKNSRSPDELLRCGKCHRLAHSTCLQSGLPPGQLEGDNFFEFTCQPCAKGGTDIVFRANLSITQLLLLTMYNLHMKNPGGHRKGFFHWKLHIYKFISQHWNDLFQGDGLRRKKRSLQGTVSAHLSHYPHFFAGGHDLLNDGGWYKLCQVLPPAVLLHQEAQKKKDKNTNVGGPTNKKARFEEGNMSDKFPVEEVYVKEEVAEVPLDESSCGSWYLERENLKPNASLPNSIFEDDYEQEEIKVKEEIKIEEEHFEDSTEDIDVGQTDVIDSDLPPPPLKESLFTQNTPSVSKPKEEQEEEEDSPRKNKVKMSIEERFTQNLTDHFKENKKGLIPKCDYQKTIDDLKAAADNSHAKGKVKMSIEERFTQNLTDHFKENKKGLIPKWDYQKTIDDLKAAADNSHAKGRHGYYLLENVRLMSQYEERQLMRQLDRMLAVASLPPHLYYLRRKLHVRLAKREHRLPIFNIDAELSSIEQHGRLMTRLERIQQQDMLSCKEMNGVRVLDRFQVTNSKSQKVEETSSEFLVKLIGETQSNAFIHSPYTLRKLKPFIRRDYESTPPKLHLLNEIIAYPHRNDPNWKPPTSHPIDYCYVTTKHIAAMNVLARQFFWPGIDLTEVLNYPDYTCVVLYRKLVIGFGILVPDTNMNEAYISFLLVNPEWRRAGIATFIVYHLIQTCLGKDITLHVSATNPALIMYQQFGFKVEEFLSEFYDKYLPEDSPECKHAMFLRLSR
ncbi:cysteine-rich protein 2-binding protein-like isoform X4 [Oratosquilla oratoria]|uniref:cysteine-rich protein 2-binding protein-like isoform X4 n=1 Tax=Oratosquilla oratoria TaxID=337810 RepID=UPI003F764EC3